MVDIDKQLNCCVACTTNIIMISDFFIINNDL